MLLLGVLLYRAAGGLDFPTKTPECMWDGLFEATEEINSFLQRNETHRAGLLIFSSFLIDVLMLNSALRFALFAKTWRSLMFMLSFYSLRGLIMGLFLMRFPEGDIFILSPGFPSLTVTYEKTADFFPSGHVGFAVFSVLENRLYKNEFMQWISWISVIVESVTMIVTRGHYSIDVIAGMIFAHYIWIATGWVSPYVDRKLISDKDSTATQFQVLAGRAPATTPQTHTSVSTSSDILLLPKNALL